MRALVVLAVLGVCLALPQQAPEHPNWTGPMAATIPAGLPGYLPNVVDTPEVQAARNQFSKTYDAQVIATAPKPKWKWTGPMASTISAGLPGSLSNVPDTLEVAAAKNAFFVTFHKQAAAAAPASPTKN